MDTPIVERGNLLSVHLESARFLWLSRDVTLRAPNARLHDLVRVDERVEAAVDALRISAKAAKDECLGSLAGGEAGAFFSVGVLAIESSDTAYLELVIKHAFEAEKQDAGDPYQPAYDPWRGMASALAWVGRTHAVGVIERLLQMPLARIRWLGVAASGARRSAVEAAALVDADPLVRASAYRTAGQLGRTDLMPHLLTGITEEDPACRFWSAWAAARMGAAEPLDILSEIARQNGPRAERALDLLLRRLDVQRANSWLREFASLPDRQRSLIRATGVIGDPLYVPWLIEHMNEPAAARLAGEAFAMITGVDLPFRDFDRRPPADFESGPNDDPADEKVALDEDDRLPWPDPAKVGEWWMKNKARFNVGTAYFLGMPKASADWLDALSDAFQRQRRAAALELAIRQPNRAMFEVRARGRLQRQLLARARGKV
jgi:uncharacterized protein (TIGR02270 family)